MASNCGHMTIPELKKELENIGVKKSGRKWELVERLEAYRRKADCARADVSGLEFLMMTPDPQLYKNLHSDKTFPGCTEAEISSFLSKFNKTTDTKGRDMNNDGFIQYMKLTFHDSHWFVRSSVKASMIKSVKYVVDVMIGQDRSVVESQCECAAGMGPDAHCKHVCTVLFACADFKKLGTYKTELACTQKLQTFHRAKPHKGSPLKARQLDMPGCDEVCNYDYDPSPVEYRGNPGYQSYFRNVCLNYRGISKTPIFQLYEQINMRAFNLDHDYLKDTFSETHLELLNVSEISEEIARQVMLKTATQAASDLWFEERNIENVCIHQCLGKFAKQLTGQIR